MTVILGIACLVAVFATFCCMALRSPYVLVSIDSVPHPPCPTTARPRLCGFLLSQCCARPYQHQAVELLAEVFCASPYMQQVLQCWLQYSAV